MGEDCWMPPERLIHFREAFSSDPCNREDSVSHANGRISRDLLGEQRAPRVISSIGEPDEARPAAGPSKLMRHVPDGSSQEPSVSAARWRSFRNRFTCSLLEPGAPG